MSAFVVIATVVFVVAGRVAGLTLGTVVDRPERIVVESSDGPDFTIQDRRGQTIALSVPRFDLEMSPRSMWQAHTPARIASKLSAALGGIPGADELLRALLPGSDSEGWITVTAWPLTPRQSFFAREWIATGADTGEAPLPGFELMAGPPHEGRQRELFVWKPALVLSKETRESYGFTSPWRWARHLATSLDRFVEPPIRRAEVEAGKRLLHEEIWRGLMPRGHCVPVRGISSDRVLEVRSLLESEGVSPWQLSIEYAADRIYPCGEHELFGSWGFTTPEDTEPVPRDGLERLAHRLVTGEAGSFLDWSGARYGWLRDRSIRGNRANGYLFFAEGSTAPVVESTLDLTLMRIVRSALEDTMGTHLAAVAEAIVIDLETGDVLAVDAVEAYDTQPFAPVYHAFTPGSTFKLLTMAIGLEEGVVDYGTIFDVGPRDHWILTDPENGRTRVIHEAEGALSGRISAAEALAFSVNAGMVQIGLRVAAEDFRSYLTPLGYGGAPHAGLGSERKGHLRELPWKYRGTHASVSFGHELSTTLWQHAAGLATILRGGEYIPLRLIAGLSQGDDVFALKPSCTERVFSESTCQTVRQMMALGASEGTGDDVCAALLKLARAAGSEQTLESLHLGTKTGTAQKVPSEMCLHVELAERERVGSISSQRYRVLKRAPKVHKACYTSSMVMVGRRPSDGRQIMTLVVVDEPRGKEKFGSKVAGQAAVTIMAEVLGFTRSGHLPERDWADGFGLAESLEENEFDEPWREGRG